MADDDLKPVTTSDTPFAAFLKYHNHVIVGMKPDDDNPQRKVFVFIAQDETDELKHDFYFGKPEVHPKRYYKSIDEVFQILKKYLRESGE